MKEPLRMQKNVKYLNNLIVTIFSKSATFIANIYTINEPHYHNVQVANLK